MMITKKADELTPASLSMAQEIDYYQDNDEDYCTTCTLISTIIACIPLAVVDTFAFTIRHDSTPVKPSGIPWF